MKIDETDNQLEKKYVQLWIKKKVNFPFMFVIDLLRKKWKISHLLSEKDSYDKATDIHKAFLSSLEQENEKYLRSEEANKYFSLLHAVIKFDQSDSYKRKVMMEILSEAPINRYHNDIANIMSIFEFEREWLHSLSFYIATDKILVPKELVTTKQFPEKIREMVGVFTIDLLKAMGKGYQNYTYMQIGEKLFGDKTAELNLTDEELGQYDDKLEERIKKYRSRFRSKDYAVILTKELADNLKLLFS